MDKDQSLQRLDDWQVVSQLLPQGWEQAARRLGALRRARGIPNANVLLRVLMVHLADGCSLKETALRARQAGWCTISSVAVFKRLQAAEPWLRWLAEQLWHGAPAAIIPSGYRVRAVDATTVEEQGTTGTNWRVHYVINLADLQCDFVELTDVHGGETFRRIPVSRGDLLLGDRAYGTPPGIDHVVGQSGSVLVRVNPKALPLLRRARSTNPAGHSLEGPPCGRGGRMAGMGPCPRPRDPRPIDRRETGASGGSLCALASAQEGPAKTEAALESGAVPGRICLRLDHDPLGRHEFGSSLGGLPCTLADRIGLQTDEIDHGSWAVAQAVGGQRTGLDSREALRGPADRTAPGRGGAFFPLGIWIGCQGGAGGVRCVTSTVNWSRR